MDVRDALLARYSVRAFLDRPVDLDLVRDMLTVASRAPSGGNLQPWTVHVLAGDSLKRFKALIAAKMDAGEVEQPEFNVYPPQIWEPLRGRRSTAARKRFAACGLVESPETTRLMQRLNYSFFGAPVGLMFTIDRVMQQGSWLDYGMFLQNVMVAARARGLDTCPQAAFTQFHRIIARHLGLRDDQTVVCGMSLGWADPAAIENTLVTEREPLEGFVRFLG